MPPSGLTPKRSMPNLPRDGYALVAAKLYERLANRFGIHVCHVLDTGEVYLTAVIDKRVHTPPPHTWVGTYTRKTQIQNIEDDLLARLREITQDRAA